MGRLSARETTEARRALRRLRQASAPPESPVRAAGPLIRWAKITFVGTSTVSAQFVDADAEVYGDAFTVRCYAASSEGVVWTPALSTASPRLVVGQYIQIVWMPGCGTARPAGWWLVGPPLAGTCAPTGEAAEPV